MIRIVAASALAAGMTLRYGGLVLAADIDENGALDYAYYLHGRIVIRSVEAADMHSAHVAVEA